MQVMPYKPYLHKPTCVGSEENPHKYDEEGTTELYWQLQIFYASPISHNWLNHLNSQYSLILVNSPILVSLISESELFVKEAIGNISFSISSFIYKFVLYQ